MPPAKSQAAKSITPKFKPHAAYDLANGDRPANFQGRFLFDVAVALPVPVDADPAQPQPPARWRKAVPLVLEVSTSGRHFTDELPLRQVSRIWCFADRKAKRPLVVIDAKDTSYSTETTFGLGHDIGAYSTTWERLRMSFPKTLVARVRANPLSELTLVGTDRAGRTVLVQQVNGLPSAYEVYAGTQVVSVMIHANYAWMSSDGSPSRTSAGYDTAIGLRDAEHQPVIPKAFTRKKPLVLEVRLETPLGKPPPLKNVAQIHVFADNWRFLQTVLPAACHYRSEDSPRLSWSEPKLIEHLRFAVRSEVAAAMRANKKWSGTVIGVDGDGKTVFIDTFSRPL